MALPEHIRTNIAQRQRQRARIAQAIDGLLSEARLTSIAGQLVRTAITLVQDDESDLNGTPGVRTAIIVEREAWQRIQQAVSGDVSTTDEQQTRRSLDTIKRVIEVQATLIELAIPEDRPLQALWDEYQQRYGKPD